jgi:hypothetical protein
MTQSMYKKVALVLAVSAAAAAALSLTLGVPYIYTLIGLAAWPVLGQIVTADDDLPGGWSNPDGTTPYSWRPFLVSVAVLASLVSLAVAFPSLRSIGGS